MKTYTKCSAMIITLCTTSLTLCSQAQYKKLDIPTSKELVEKFERLVALTEENPGNAASQAYTYTFKNRFKDSLDRLFIASTKSSLSKQCKTLLTGGKIDFDDPESFFTSLIDPNTLRMIAYMQRKYGELKPSRYTPIPDSDEDNPVIGGYHISRSEFIPITSYRFLDTLLLLVDAINQTIVPGSVSEKYTKRIQQITKNLDAAIAMAETNTPDNVANITDTRALEADFDAITRKLRNLVTKGNKKIIVEMEHIFNVYK